MGGAWAGAKEGGVLWRAGRPQFSQLSDCCSAPFPHPLVTHPVPRMEMPLHVLPALHCAEAHGACPDRARRECSPPSPAPAGAPMAPSWAWATPWQ